MDWTEWLKTLSPLIAVAFAATLAWLVRREEQLRDTYGEWAGAACQFIAVHVEPAPDLYFPSEIAVPNPIYVERAKVVFQVDGNLRTADARLRSREPCADYRRWIGEMTKTLLSDTRRDTLATRREMVDQVVAQVAENSRLVLRLRDYKTLP